MPFNKTKISSWIGAMRLKTLPLSLSSIIAGTSLALLENSFDSTIFLFSVLTTVSLQVLSNFANDYGDAEKGTDNENRLGPTRAVQSGIISLQEMKLAVHYCSVLAFLFGLALLYFSFKDHLLNATLFLALGICSIYAAIKYTAGKNAYGYKGYGDIAVLIFFGWVGVWGSSFLYTKSLNLSGFLLSTAFGLLATGVLNINNIRDIVNDKLNNKITFAVRLGKTKASIYQIALSCFSIFCLVTFSAINFKPIKLFAILPASLLPLIISFKLLNNPKPELYNSSLKWLSLSTFLISLVVLACAAY